MWNDPASLKIVSLNDAAQPLAYIYPPPQDPVDDGTHINTSYAAIISSVGRKSYSQDKDPFYLTNQSPNERSEYIVLPGRPVLSCWEDAIWKYDDQPYSVRSLHNVSDIPPALIDDVLEGFLSVPKIFSVMLYLGPSVLLSAVMSFGEYFDSGSTSIHADLSPLVLASYIGTSNTMTIRYSSPPMAAASSPTPSQISLLRTT